GDLNIGRSDVIAPAPQLAVSPQRTAPALGGSGKAIVPPPPSLEASTGSGVAGSSATGRQGSLGHPGSAQVVPPPPSVPGATASARSGRPIALGIHPSVAPPSEPPQGNRRGTFAAAPGGKPGAAGTPDIKGDAALGTDGHGMGNGSAHGNGAGTGASNGAPPGLHVEAPQRAATAAVARGSAGTKTAGTGDPSRTVMASASPEPRVNAPAASVSASAHGPKVDVIDNPSPMERKVFGGRRLYSMTLNMPNLNSAGGSWVIRFAELGSGEAGEVIAPMAEHQVD